ncbi:hypothetical protein [Mesorhizobium sp. M7A.F.Ca.US.008.03.1.1]|uniref:hypothetical protein n=1 Tax=Mesorhizobium sp. M7A.F.Ca.US.008.03.1.1 TaxID=2496742 RepID=UPI001FE1FF92|nr:hypothetical protein [Mesorhizobium sp. M7A.F.Ca.US.008.03.1.1]
MAGVQIIRSPAAEDDLIDIWLAIAEHSPRAADHFWIPSPSASCSLPFFPSPDPEDPISALTRER